MKTDFKTWLETTGLKVGENRFIKPPPLPYLVFMNRQTVRGADLKNTIAENSVTVELYADSVDVLSESKMEGLLNEKGLEYTKERIWIDGSNFFQTIYEFQTIEKL